MDKVYLETSIISYLVSKPSKDIILLSHQLITEDWWEKSRKNYDLYVSVPTIYEISRGDTEYSEKRLKLVESLKTLDAEEEIKDLISMYMKHYKLPKKFELDITHIAYSVYYEMDYLLTWNCKHIANAHFRVQISNFNREKGLHITEICTPEELNKKWR